MSVRMETSEIIADLAVRMTSRLAGWTTGYGETQSLCTVLECAVKPHRDQLVLLREPGYDGDPMAAEAQEELQKLDAAVADICEVYSIPNPFASASGVRP